MFVVCKDKTEKECVEAKIELDKMLNIKTGNNV
jgi:hypothetical protein